MRSALVALLSAVVVLTATGCEDSSLGPVQRGTIEGQVQDFETNTAIAGANITTSPPTGALVTDSDGRFTLDNVEAGNYTVSAKKSGYDANQVSIAVQTDAVTEATLFLEPSDAASASSDSIDVTVTNWANRAPEPDSVFVDVEYRVQNVGGADVDAYEVYFHIQTGGVDFYYEAQGDSLAVAQTDVAQFSKYLRDRSASSVAVDDYWIP